jgi:hypothetical protein
VSAHDSLAGNTITTGPGNSQIIGGSGNNKITVGAGDSVVIAANGKIVYVFGRPVLATSWFTDYGGVDQVTIAGSSTAVTGASAYGKVGAGVAILSHGGGALHAPGSYLVVGVGGTGTYSSSKHGWINPHAKKPKKSKKHKKPKKHKKHKKHKKK